MPKRVSQKEWDERAAAVGLKWIGEVAGSQSRSPAVCTTCGYEWNAHPNVVTRGGGCPSCSGHAPVSQGQWDERAAAVEVEWLAEVESSRSKTPGRCKVCGHEWMCLPELLQRGSGCPECANVRRADSRRYPQEVWDQRAAAVGMEWLEPVKGSELVRARCLICGRVTAKSPSHVREGKGCRHCARNAPVSQEAWDERAAAIGADWLTPVEQTKTKAPIQCRGCDTIWEAIPGNVQQGQACPACADANKGAYQILSQVEWETRAAAVGVEWLEKVTTSSVPTAARCIKCGFEWEPRPNNVARGAGCPVCADYGFQPTRAAVIYLVVKSNGVAKVGITGAAAREDRLVRHRKNGYDLVQLWTFEEGMQAEAVEHETIRRWREDDDLLPAALEGEDGWTETVHTDSLPVEEIIKRINKLAREQSSFKA